MPLPPEIDNQIRQRFEELEDEANRLLSTHIQDQTETVEIRRLIEGVTEEDIRFSSDLQKLKTNFINLLQMLSSKKNSFSNFIKDVGSKDISELRGIIVGFRNDYENGMLNNIAEMIEANVVADYLEQAEQLLKANKKGEYNYIPAAVLAGAVMEDGLRRLCTRQSPPISINKRGGYPKTLGSLIDDLKKAGLFNELKAKQLRAWADIRNAAAHGNFDDFTRSDVEQMIPAVETFLADYL